MSDRVGRLNALRDGLLRDPRGRLLDALPWFLRRLHFAWHLREWPWRIPSEVRLIGCRRPPQRVFDYFRELHRLDDA